MKIFFEFYDHLIATNVCGLNILCFLTFLAYRYSVWFLFLSGVSVFFIDLSPFLLLFDLRVLSFAFGFIYVHTYLSFIKMSIDNVPYKLVEPCLLSFVLPRYIVYLFSDFIYCTNAPDASLSCFVCKMKVVANRADDTGRFL